MPNSKRFIGLLLLFVVISLTLISTADARIYRTSQERWRSRQSQGS